VGSLDGPDFRIFEGTHPMQGGHLWSCVGNTPTLYGLQQCNFSSRVLQGLLEKSSFFCGVVAFLPWRGLSPQRHRSISVVSEDLSGAAHDVRPAQWVKCLDALVQVPQR
jgi:hypothetical protein